MMMQDNWCQRWDEEKPYSIIKEALLERLSSAKPDVLRSLKSIKLNGRRPYNVLTDIRGYCTRLHIESEDFQKELLIEAMPDHIKLVLLPLKDTLSLDQIAQTADSLLSSLQVQQQIQPVKTVHTSDISELRKELNEKTEALSDQLNALSV